MSDPRALMQEGRFREAAVLYEHAAITAHQAGDLPTMKGNALMTVKAYACAREGAQALRFAIATIDVLAASPLASEIPAYARHLRLPRLRRAAALKPRQSVTRYAGVQAWCPAASVMVALTRSS